MDAILNEDDTLRIVTTTTSVNSIKSKEDNSIKSKEDNSIKSKEDNSIKSKEDNSIKPPVATTLEWHQRLGHAATSSIAKMKANGLIRTTGKYDSSDCTVCSASKIIKQPSHQHFRPTHEKYDCIHVDIIGGGETLPFGPSAGGNKYLMTITDDFTNRIWAYPLPDRSRATPVLEAFITYVANRLQRYPRRLRSDNEFKPISSFCEKNGIDWESSAPYTKDQDGRAERTNRTIVTAVRCMLIDSKLPHDLWGKLQILLHIYAISFLHIKQVSHQLRWIRMNIYRNTTR